MQLMLRTYISIHYTSSPFIALLWAILGLGGRVSRIPKQANLRTTARTGSQPLKRK